MALSQVSKYNDLMYGPAGGAVVPGLNYELWICSYVNF